MSEQQVYELCLTQIHSSYFIEQTRHININASLFIIVIGLIGNSFAFLVFMQKKIRSSSTSIYLLCLTTSDSLYLMAHFFEDTLKSYIDHYLNKTNFVYEDCLIYDPSYNATHPNTWHEAYNQHIANRINIIDRNDFCCRFINFARYFLRFVSAYIIVAFTIQRTRAIRSPFLRKKLESKRLLRSIACVILFFGVSSAVWIPFVLHSQYDSYSRLPQCDIKNEYSSGYFVITNIYIIVIMLIPMIIICICNTISIKTLYNWSKTRKLFLNSSTYKSNLVRNNSKRYTNEPDNNSTLLDIFNDNLEQSVEIETNGQQQRAMSVHTLTHQEKKTNIMLILISFSYVLLDLPYFVSWFIVYYHYDYNKFQHEDSHKLISYATVSNYLIGFINLTEILYLLNFGIHFYIYCGSSKIFRDQFRLIFNREIFFNLWLFIVVLADIVVLFKEPDDELDIGLI